MENVLTGVSLVVFLPMLGLLINLFLGKYLGEYGVGLVAVTASGGAFIMSLLMLAGLSANDYQAVIVNPPLLDSWIQIPAAGVDIPWQFRVDSLSVIMMLVVSGVGTLIHIYAVGYMHGDSRFPRFFVYLNLFLMFMMLLVTGNNLLMLFVGWEGVGLCSYLLIGFWFDKTKRDKNGVSEGWRNSNAARKAFVVNRIGDFGVLMAIFLTFYTFGTLDFYKVGEVPLGGHAEHGEEASAEHEADAESATSEEAAHTEESAAESHSTEMAVSEMGIFSQAESYFAEGGHTVSFGSVELEFKTIIILITLFMLLGATGKSAQIPLFIWLPDAMAGPTPVSALIHAATMVTAGVYMMVRANSFFYHADLTSFIVTLIGSGTAIMAGFIAIGQWDIKRVLAYSTVSQLGFMVAAVGVGAYTAAMFHLVTHAVFKALLFLGSGSVIHGMEHGHHHLHEHHDHDEHHGGDDFDPQDMRTMGGLRHKMPITYWTYIAGTLALAGVFPFAGFWSKDEILGDSFVVGWEDGELKGFIALLILVAAAGFTAFYMWRQVSLVFYGKPRHASAEHARESHWLMWLPLAVLASGALIIGFLNVPANLPLLPDLFGEHEFASFLEHSVIHAHAGDLIWWLALGTLGIALGAIFFARELYNDRVLADFEKDPLELNPQTADAFALANAKLYWDEFYYRYVERPYNVSSQWVANVLDWQFWHDFVHENIIFSSFHMASNGLSNNVDRGAIDKGIMLVLGKGVDFVAKHLRRVQTGYVRVYALTVVLGTVVVLIVIMFPLLRDLIGV